MYNCPGLADPEFAGESQVDDGTEHRGKHLGRIRRLLTWLPHWAVALLLLLPIMAVETFELLLLVHWLPWEVEVYTLGILGYVAFIIPGALKRLSWRHILVMLGIGAALLALAQFFPWRDLPIPFFYTLLLGVALTMIAVGLGEWALTSRSRQGLALVVLASVAAACAGCVIYKSVQYCGWRLTVPTPGSMTGKSIEYSNLLYRPLLALLMWVAIPLSLRAGRSQKRRSILIFGGTAVACAAAFLVFFHSLMYTIAEDSLGGQGIFHRWRAAELLGYRATDADLKALRAELEKADWSVARDLHVYYDWRAECIHYLGRHRPKATADYLSALLRSRPTPHLASSSANLLAEQRRYEAVLTLMRYGLLADDLGSSVWCVGALERMKLPRAALPVLRNAAKWDFPRSLGPGFRITQGERERLAILLGKDVGANLSDWVGYYEKVIDDLPTPLPQPYKEQTDRVIRCAADYREAQSRLYHGRCILIARWLREDGEGELADDKLQRAKILMGKSDLERLIVMRNDQKLMLGYGVDDRYYERTARDLAVQEPNLDAPTTDDLRREIDKYVEAVRKATAEALKKIQQAAPAARP